MAEQPNLRQRQKDRTRTALVAAARDHFAQAGFAATTIDDITSTVGCSRATFYLHFSSKSDILRAVGAETMTVRARDMYARLDDVLQAGSRDALEQWMRDALAWFEANRSVLPAWDEASVLDPSFRTQARAALTELVDAMPTYVSRWSTDRLDEARLRIELLVSQLERFFTRWAIQGSIDATAEEAAATLAEIWFPVLSGTTGQPENPTPPRR